MHTLAQVWDAIIAEHLSVRLIIGQARRVLVGSWSEAVFTSLACAAYDARSRSIEDSKGRRQRQNESRCMKDG